MAAADEERRAVRALIDALAGSGKPLVVATATGVLGDTGAALVDETFSGQPDFSARIRIAVEEEATAAAHHGVRGIVVRPAIFVHDHDASQFVPMLVESRWLAPPTSPSRSKKLDGLEDWIAERFRRHAGNADVVRQELASEKKVVVSLRTVERAVAHLGRELRAEARATIRFETRPGARPHICPRARRPCWMRPSSTVARWADRRD